MQSFSTATSAFAELDLQDQAKLHDYLMTAPIAFAGMVDAFEKQTGAEQQVNVLRTKSADLFVEVFKVSHTNFFFLKKMAASM